MNKTISPPSNFVYPCLQEYKKQHYLGMEHKIKKGLFQKYKKCSWFFCMVLTFLLLFCILCPTKNVILRQYTNRIFNQKGIKYSKSSRILEEREFLITKNKSLLNIDENMNPQDEDLDEKKKKLEKRINEILTKCKNRQTDEYISPLIKYDIINEHKEQTNIGSCVHHYNVQKEKYDCHNTISHNINYFNYNEQFNHSNDTTNLNPTNDTNQINNLNYSQYNNNLDNNSAYEQNKEKSLVTFNSTQIHKANHEQTYFYQLPEEQQFQISTSDEYKNINFYNEESFRALSDMNKTNNNIPQEFKDYIESYLQQKYHIMTNEELDTMNKYRIEYIKYKTLYEYLIKKAQKKKLLKEIKLTLKVTFIIMSFLITLIICPTCVVSLICVLAVCTYLSFL
ncbi:putative exported protein [Plasmodium gaboni]|uniref:Putative exported protein n=1 Tax=Plasmodium gaboni TaxID=647221 RepID=A0A151LH91_9APIC|nr:putative exported protein [Plasmodium gaboni]KYN98303.1 putative exported protein [Plasmodium gaboni]